MKAKKIKRIQKAALAMIHLKGSATTLEIKEQLRITHPDKKWNQTDVSLVMLDFEKSSSDLTSTDNGQYKTYYLNNTVSAKPASPVKSTKKKVSKTAKVAKVAKPKKVKKTTATKKDRPQPVIDITGADKISKTAAVELIRNSKGNFFTVGFVKTDGDVRYLNGVVKASNFMNSQGYINVTESNGNKRQINPRTILALKISKKTYVTK